MITGKVINKEIDASGNILVTFEFALTDGSKIAKTAKYNWQNFSAAEIEANIKNHCEELMKKVYGLQANQDLLNSIDLSKINVEISKVPVTIQVVTKQADGTFIQSPSTITISDADIK